MAMSSPQASLAQARGSDHHELTASARDTPPSTGSGVLPMDPAAALAMTSSVFPSGEADSLGGPQPPSGPSLVPPPAGSDTPGVLDIRRRSRITKCVTFPVFCPLITAFAGSTSFHPSSGSWGRPSFGVGAF